MAKVSLVPFSPSATPAQADIALKQAIKTFSQAHHCAVLWFHDIKSRNLFRDLGYSSIYAYARQELGFSNSKTGDFLRLARALENLPQLKKEMEDGRIGYTKAREVITVATPETEKDWINKARTKTRRNLQEDVKAAKLQARRKLKAPKEQIPLLPPESEFDAVIPLKHKISLEFTGEQLARWEAIWEKIRKIGAIPADQDKAEGLLQALELMTRESKEGQGPDSIVTPGVHIHVHQCPECDKAEVISQRGGLPLTPLETERLSENAVIHRQGKRSKATIPPATRRKVMERDRHRCQGPGCTNTGFLEIHHRIPRSRGGTNHLKNLITLCSSCHRLHHQGGRADLGGASLARECPPGGKIDIPYRYRLPSTPRVKEIYHGPVCVVGIPSMHGPAGVRPEPGDIPWATAAPRVPPRWRRLGPGGSHS